MSENTELIYDSSPNRTSSEEGRVVKELCEANGWDIPERESDSWYGMLAQQDMLDREWFWDQVKEFDRKYGKKVSVSGRLGLWDGKHEINPVEFESLEAAVDKCISSSIEDVRAYEDENGNFMLDCSHHDGTNSFMLSRPKGKALKFCGAMWGRKYPCKKKGAA